LIQLGAPTILINNAGIVHKKSILDTTIEEVEQYVRPYLRNVSS
jgi:short-subunit dehydrogenase